MTALDTERSLVRLVAVYLAHLTHRGLKGGTVTAQRITFTTLLRRLARLRVRTVQQVREVHLASWVVWLKTATRDGHPRFVGSTIANHILAVRAFFRWLASRGVVLLDPARELTTAGLSIDPVGRRVVPTEGQMRELLDHLPRRTRIQVRDTVILELMYSSGLRTCEVRQLDVYDVDLAAGTVRVRSGKGGKDHVVPVGRVARAALALWLDTVRPHLRASEREPALFVTQTGRRLGRTVVWRRVRELRRRGTLRVPRPHEFRHACAVHLLRGGADVRYIMELLGHAHVRTTAIYTRLLPADLKEAHRRCHPRERHKDFVPR